MKEQIYTIPVNEAFDTPCECPLCVLEKKLEDEAIDYALGAAMMEPDWRIESNEKGYCNRHISQMFEVKNKLSLALVLDTYLDEARSKIKDASKKFDMVSKPSLFKKSDSKEFLKNLSETLHNINSSCIICDRINHTMESFITTIFYMWQKDDDFKKKFEASKGLCLKHFEMLVQKSDNYLHGKNHTEFLRTVISKEEKELNRIQDDIHKFTLKFDYRNRDMDWGTAEDAPIRTVEKIAGFLHNNEERK